VAKVHVRRELPSTIVLDVVEREPACAIGLGAVYLADAEGSIFKRATPDEAAGLPVVTGIARDEYLAQPDAEKTIIKGALAAISTWRNDPTRVALGEAHVDRVVGLTLYTERGIGVRVGAVDDTLGERLRRYDAVARALKEGGEEPRLIYVDNRARPDRVTVKLASAVVPAHSGTKLVAAGAGERSGQPRN
jgi:cell division protein FtsQ